MPTLHWKTVPYLDLQRFAIPGGNQSCQAVSAEDGLGMGLNYRVDGNICRLQANTRINSKCVFQLHYAEDIAIWC